jgi:hypothetical protein
MEMKIHPQPSEDELRRFRELVLVSLPELSYDDLRLWLNCPKRLSRNLKQAFVGAGSASKLGIKLRIDYSQSSAKLLELAKFAFIEERFDITSYPRNDRKDVVESDVWRVYTRGNSKDEILEVYEAYGLRPLNVVEFLTLAAQLPETEPPGFEALTAFGLDPAVPFSHQDWWPNLFYMDDEDDADEGMPQGKWLSIEGGGDCLLAVAK